MDETAPARTYGEGQGAARGALLRLEPGRVSEAANPIGFLPNKNRQAKSLGGFGDYQSTGSRL